MKKLITAFIVLLSMTAFSQEKSISGTVTDDTGEPLVGVTLIITGTDTGSTTDFDGAFSVDAKVGDVLAFSYLGMKDQNVTVTDSNTYTVVLEGSDEALDEVVIIGYGTAKKSDLTGSVATVDVQQALVAPQASLDNALQGRATGVQVTSVNGSPGSSASIRIRGGNSITAGNQPLYVIDGYVGAGGINTINPNDIESIQVLKDASSTAIYGARGTNGVILVTTKKGREGKMKVNFKTSVGVQSLPNQIDNQTGYEYAAWVNSQDQDPDDGLPFDLDNLPGEETDWQDVMTRDAVVQDYQLSVSGGSESTQYYTSVGYFSQDGIVEGTGFDRFTVRTNVDTQISKVFKTGLNVLLSRTNNDNNNINFRDMVREDPLKPVYDEDGNYNGINYGISNSTGDNLLAQNEINTNETLRSRVFANAYIQAKFAKHFTWLSTFGGDFIWNKQNQFIPSTYPGYVYTNRQAWARIDQDNSNGLLNENTLLYENTWGDHRFDALGGITWQKNTSETSVMTGSEIPSDGTGIYGIEYADVENTSLNQRYSENALFSLFARANYTYKDKYLVTATIRRDGSSRLGENNKYATFPSFALGWNMSEESFLENATSLDRLKIRASFGKTGNQGITPFSTLAAVGPDADYNSIINQSPKTGVGQTALANPDLRWETTAQYDIGIEVSLFQRRLTAEIDFYYKKTEDLLLEAEVPTFTGFQTQIQNVGSLDNRGVDVNITGVIVRNENFDMSASLNLSTNKNEVLDLGIKSFIETNRLPAPANDVTQQLMVGQPVGTFWGAIYEGIDPATGDAIFKDISGPDGVPDGQFDRLYDKTVIGDANPDFYGGFELNMRYKNWDLMSFFPFSYGNENYNNEAYLVPEVQVNSFAQLRDNMWSAANPDNATVPGTQSSSFNNSNSFYIQDASYFRFGTLQIGYTFPSAPSMGLSNLRIYFTGTNLFVVHDSDYWGYDPEVSSYGDSDTERGFDRIAYPQSRNLLIGLDITF